MEGPRISLGHVGRGKSHCMSPLPACWQRHNQNSVNFKGSFELKLSISAEEKVKGVCVKAGKGGILFSLELAAWGLWHACHGCSVVIGVPTPAALTPRWLRYYVQCLLTIAGHQGPLAQHDHPDWWKPPGVTYRNASLLHSAFGTSGGSFAMDPLKYLLINKPRRFRMR